MKRFLYDALVVTALFGGSLLVMSACSATHESAEKVDCSTQCVDGTNTRVVKNPEGFRNVLMTCDGTTGLYVTSRGDKAATPVGSDLEIYPNDPRCDKPANTVPAVGPRR